MTWRHHAANHALAQEIKGNPCYDAKQVAAQDTYRTQDMYLAQKIANQESRSYAGSEDRPDRATDGGAPASHQPHISWLLGVLTYDLHLLTLPL